MTREQFIEKLKIVAEMGDKQIETLANLIIDYLAGGGLSYRIHQHRGGGQK